MAFQANFVQPNAFQTNAAASQRLWALKRGNKYLYFDDLHRLESFKRADDAIHVPRATEAVAKAINQPVKLVATAADFDRLRQIEQEIEMTLRDERDDEDFIQFLAVL